jgi:plastocyanin
MSRDVRSRVLLGVGIPIAAFVFLGALIVAFSRILLAVPVELAPWVALLFATNILVGCALAAMIPGTRGFTFLIGILVATIAIGGIAGWVVGPREVHSLVEEGEHVTAGKGEEADGALGDAEPGQAVPIGAEGLEFDTSELSLPAGSPSVIAFDNQDQGFAHNVSIYTEQGGESLFEGEFVTGPTQVEYEVPPLEPGEYYFQCDAHPTTMTGTVTVG